MIKHKTVFEGGCGLYVEKKSKFIAHVEHVDSVEEAQEYIEAVKKRFWDARHNCSAFRVGTDQIITRCSDDGEPSGTAGKPILEVILGQELHDLVIVVTRYFGGTLLGTGGLVRAYTDASKAGIDQSVVVEKIPGKRVEIQTDYTDIGKIQYLFAQNDVLTESTDYTDKVVVHALFADETKDMMRKKLTEATSGHAVITETEAVYFGKVDGQPVLFEE